MAINSARAACFPSLTLFLFLCALTDLCGIGLPEPDLIHYGVVTDESGRTVTEGTLEWQFRDTNSGRMVTHRTELSSINGQFSYVLSLPAEARVPGQDLSDSAVELAPTPIPYDRSAVNLNGVPLFFSNPDQATTSWDANDRGSVIQIDLSLSAETPGGGGDNDQLLDSWELRFFGNLSATNDEDPDNDGAPNLAEQRAGTDPTDPDSVFAFTQVSVDTAGIVTVEWLSSAGQRYSVLRSSTPSGPFEPIASDIFPTVPRNRFTDESAAPGQVFFYLLETEPTSPQ